MASTTASSRCRIVLYYLDARVALNARLHETQLHFSSETGQEAHTRVCRKFHVINEWDRKLFKCMFLDDVQLDLFRFHRTSEPSISLHATIDGDRNVVFIEGQEPYQPIERSAHIQVESMHMGEKVEYELDFAGIKNRMSKSFDYSIATLYNSENFNRFAEGSATAVFTRELRKVS